MTPFQIYIRLSGRKSRVDYLKLLTYGTLYVYTYDTLYVYTYGTLYVYAYGTLYVYTYGTLSVVLFLNPVKGLAFPWSREYDQVGRGLGPLVTGRGH